MTLILGRRLNQTIVLQTSDGEIRVTVHQLGPQLTKLAIAAPRSVKVDREEVAIAKRTGKPVAECRGLCERPG